MFARDAFRSAHNESSSFVAASRAIGGGIMGEGPREYGSRGGRTGDTYDKAEQMRHFQGYVYSIIRVIANRIAGQPIHLARVKGQIPADRSGGSDLWKQKAPLCMRSRLEAAQPITSHPLLTAFQSPNPIMTPYPMLFTTSASIELTGEAYWWIQDADGNGTPEIWPIPASWVEPVHTDEKLFAEYKITMPGVGTPQTVPGEEIIRFYLPDPSDPLMPLSPLRAMARTVLADESIEESQRRGFLNDMAPGLAIIVGKPQEQAGIAADQPTLTTEQRKQILNALKQNLRGVLNYNEPLILDGLIRDVKRISQTNRELDFLNSGSMTKSRLAHGWGVNPIVMGEIEDANRASAAIAEQNFLDNVINPRLNMLSEIMTTFMAPRFARNGEKLVLYFEKATAIDPDYELARDSAYLDRAVISRNEVRGKNNLEPIKDGRNAFISMGMTPTPIEVEPKREGNPYNERAAETNLAEYLGDEAIQKVYALASREIEYRFASSLRDTFVSMGQKFAHEARKIAKHDLSADLVASLIDEKFVKQLIETSRPFVTEAAMMGAVLEWELHTEGKSFRARKGILDRFRKLPGRIVSATLDWVGKLMGLDHWIGIIDTVRQDAEREAEIARQTSMTVGESVDAVVRHVFGSARSSTRADGVAQTEATGATNAGSQESRRVLESAGVVFGKRWGNQEDGRVRPTHKAAGGQIVGVEDKFTVGGYQADYPCDPSLPASERCGCRCFVVSVRRK